MFNLTFMNCSLPGPPLDLSLTRPTLTSPYLGWAVLQKQQFPTLQAQILCPSKILVLPHLPDLPYLPYLPDLPDKINTNFINLGRAVLPWLAFPRGPLLKDVLLTLPDLSDLPDLPDF